MVTIDALSFRVIEDIATGLMQCSAIMYGSKKKIPSLEWEVGSLARKRSRASYSVVMQGVSSSFKLESELSKGKNRASSKIEYSSKIGWCMRYIYSWVYWKQTPFKELSMVKKLSIFYGISIFMKG